MKLIQAASPFGVFIIGVVLLTIGYTFYSVGLSTNDTGLRDSGILVENIGVTLMAAAVILYILAHIVDRLLA